MKIIPNVASLAALALGVAMVVAPPAFSQTVTHHNAQKTGSAMSRQKIESGRGGYRTGPVFNYVPQQQGGGGPQCGAPLSPGGISTAADSCGGPGWNPPANYK